VKWPEQPGHDVLAVSSAHLLDEGRAVFVEIPDITPCQQLHLFANFDGLVSHNFYFTLHHLGGDFTNFAGYCPHMHHATAAAQPFVIPEEKLPPVPWEKGEPGRAIKIQSAPGLQYAQKEFRVKAGERISLTFENPDLMPHNFVLLKPGAENRVGEMANMLVTKPEAISMHYVPESPDIICHTRLVNPSSSCTIHFNAPATRGDYPYMCTFPGHWMIMRGVMHVE
jgi:azurin